MTSLERTLSFMAGREVDGPPFHPIVMRFTAGYAGVKYRDFCLDYGAKVGAVIKCAEDFGMDWVTVMSDPYAEAEAFGLKVEYPEDDLPKHVGLLINDISDVNKLTVPPWSETGRMRARVREVEEFARRVGDKFFIVGWAEGPMAEYSDLRGLADACLDLYDWEREVNLAFDVILENALRLIKAQVEAGAHCIGIGDAACSQISPEFYRRYVFARERELVDYTHSLGALAKLHICGNTTGILPDMIATGADIIDVDHLVADMSPFAGMLGPSQVLSGNSDPVEVVMRGTPETIRASVRKCWAETGGRNIISAGCEVPIGTPVENLRAFGEMARDLR
ncbi:MAG: uroporphyrinogen decarboxylase family protein [Armatimonadota bacterium]